MEKKNVINYSFEDSIKDFIKTNKNQIAKELNLYILSQRQLKFLMGKNYREYLDEEIVKIKNKLISKFYKNEETNAMRKQELMNEIFSLFTFEKFLKTIAVQYIFIKKEEKFTEELLGKSNLKNKENFKYFKDLKLNLKKELKLMQENTDKIPLKRREFLFFNYFEPILSVIFKICESTSEILDKKKIVKRNKKRYKRFIFVKQKRKI